MTTESRGAGLVAGAWQANPLLFGYSSRLFEQIKELNCATGTNVLVSTTVPVGEVHRITRVSFVNVHTNPSKVFLGAVMGGVTGYFQNSAGAGADVYEDLAVDLVMSAGDFFSCTFQGCTLNDDIYLNVWGYKTDIDQ